MNGMNYLRTTLSVSALILVCSASMAQTTLNDYSNRISLSDKQLVAGFNDDGFDGFVADEGLTLSIADGSIFGVRPHEGSGVLMVQPKEGIPGNVWKTIAKTGSFDFSETPVAEFAIFSQEGPVTEQYVRLRLFSGSKIHESQAQIIPSLWRTAIFDLSDCSFLDKVDKIEIGFMCNYPEPWNNGRDFMLDGLYFGKPLDLTFMLPASTEGFKAQDGKVKWKKDALVYRFTKGGRLSSPDLAGSRNSMFSPSLGSTLDDRNTFFVVMENRSRASKVLLRWTTDKAQGSKEFSIDPKSRMKAYYFNISDCPEAAGHLQSFSLEPVDGTRGQWKIDQIRFELEDALVEYAGTIASCTADKEKVRITGTVSSEYASSHPTLVVYEYPFKHDGEPLSSHAVLFEGPASETFEITSIPNSRLDGRMTNLSTRFLAVVRNEAGETVPVGKPFYITNWRDFSENPYSFEVPGRQFNVLDYGAKGDGFTDDTKAIQKAIDAASKAGGGQVVLPGDDTRYGRRYVATHLTLRDNMDFHIEEGAILWQSYDMRNYDYIPAYGHDFIIPGCQWTHCLFVNYPLLQGNFLHDIKVTGPGTIRMADPYTVNPDWTHYARTCSDRIHICPIVICNSRNVEFSDIDVLRSNNYHTNFHTDTSLFVGNVKMYEVQCVSGDGVSLGQGTRDVLVDRIFLDSNDDGIVLSNSYRDPRGKVAPWRHDVDSLDHSVRNVTVVHSYINSATKGAGKAIALIPWGSTNPDLTHQELDSIFVYDNVLVGGHSVGTWCDNPHDDKPFTNMEQDDYAPVKNFYIFNNDYQSLCDILWVKPTTFVTDCGLHSSSEIINGSFADGNAYWTMFGKANAVRGYAYAKDGGSIVEGLYLKPGRYTFSAEVSGNGELVARKVLEDCDIAASQFAEEDWTEFSLTFTIEEEEDVFLGLRGSESKMRNCSLGFVEK